jgi:hypothetical protein
MPAKNQTKTKQSESAKTEKSVKLEKPTKKTTKVEATPVKEEVKQTEQVEANFKAQSDDDKTRKSVKKAGRTLLVKSASSSAIDGTVFDSLEGLTDKAETKSTNSFFLTFDNVGNAVNAFRKLRADSNTYRVKFSYYRIFFTMDGLTDSTDYNQVKKELTDYVSKHTSSNVLYCKFYRKDSKFLGCGDFTIDTLTGMNTLLSKDGGNKEYSFGSFKGTFYRYNGKKGKTTEQSVEASN